ncbi:hypothetical protein HYV50_01235 [Candidatus Pacearchaeota archaeon]|nr:hypothetical protein [Candidatus Pacearchaeota archaeon]
MELTDVLEYMIKLGEKVKKEVFIPRQKELDELNREYRGMPAFFSKRREDYNARMVAINKKYDHSFFREWEELRCKAAQYLMLSTRHPDSTDDYVIG